MAERGSYLIEEVEREGIGYSIELGDAETLRDAVISMMEHPEKCAEMGRRAKLLYEEKYSYDIAMKKYDSVMTEKCGIMKNSKYQCPAQSAE